MEDDLLVRTWLEALVGCDGHGVHAVESGDAALIRLEFEKFDLVITDYWMPRMKGDGSIAVLIKERAVPNLPIILARAVRTGQRQHFSQFDPRC